MKRAAAALLLLAGCARPAADSDRNELYNAGAASLHPTAQAVTIGSDGAQAPACRSRGRVVNLAGGSTLAVHAAPFDDADQLAALPVGAPVFLCGQSMDQRWTAVIVPPADMPDGDCGVTVPVASPRAYAGPCRAGWALASFVALAPEAPAA